ncbi:transcription factor PIF4-like isoform X2 [Abrus precatorius]|uniref:Transcription factor PIF4-like isoform X2 n=1 Tax=Abrus precatorius TaxID=3816 RepID=A0A8B8MPE7_ABRPR|nr:transcription factor PIF4-like isoform X2 [Abrus precatorius]
MNSNVPGWDFESDTCLTNQKKLIGLDQEFVELLWQNGQVVMHSQTHRKPVGNSSNLRQVQKSDQSTLTSGTCGNSSNLTQDETYPWIHYPLEDPLEQQFYSNLSSELPSCEVETFKPIGQLEGAKFDKFVASSAPHATSSSRPPNMKPSYVQGFRGNPIPDPRFHVPDSSQKINDFGGSRKVLNFSHFSAPRYVSSSCGGAQFRENVTSNVSQSEAREYSVMTIGSSHCGSNHIPQDQDVSRISSNGIWATTTTTATTISHEPEAVRDCIQRTVPRSDQGKSEKIEPTVTSSSGGSGGTSIERTCSLSSTRNQGQKRKDPDVEAQEEQSEATELKSGDRNKASQRIGSSIRNRAAEVHNLSERRRRDRINEKMRALQQLIPNSNKTDKASMLEEAIEYLKSLQLQLQVMWMGAGMSPVMFPGIQHYMSQMNMGMAAPSLPSIHNPMQLPKVPNDQSMSMTQIPNQTLMCQNPVLGAFSYQNLMQNPYLSEQYARYMGYHLMQSASQPMNVFRYGSQAVQHSQTIIAPSNNNNGPMNGTANIDDAVLAPLTE